MADFVIQGSASLWVFWRKEVANFGDALSALVTAHMAGRDVVHAAPGKCDLFATSSILQVARRNLKTRRADGVRPWVWARGLLAPVKVGFLDKLRIALLRGPVAAALLGVEVNHRYGDPGLLAPEVAGLAPERRDRIGIVAHHSHGDDPELVALVARKSALEPIDVRDHARAVCRQIASCRHVFAANLHGLNDAVAYGMPTTWLDPQSQSRLKYVDYAASDGRDIAASVGLGDIPGLLKHLSGVPLADRDGIARARAALTDTFPAPLRAAATWLGSETL